jgi:hypothetical protein
MSKHKKTGSMKTKNLSTAKMKKISSYLPFIFIILTAGCIKTEDRCPTYRLPSETRTGQNTIGCLIDGMVMVPNRGAGGGFLIPEYTRRFRYNEETGELYFRIWFYADEKDYECGYSRRLLIFSANEIFSEGEVETDKLSAHLDINPEWMGSLEIYRYQSDLPDLSAKVIIANLDTINNIISGTFDLEMYQNVGGVDDWDFDNKLVITNSRFDFNYRQDGGNLDGYSN